MLCPVVLLLVALLVQDSAVQAQRDCTRHRESRVLTPTTTMAPSVNLSCPVDLDAEVPPLEQFLWVWLRLATDNSIDTQITDRVTAGRPREEHSTVLQ